MNDRLSSAALLLVLAAGCSGGTEPLDLPDGCNPLLGGLDCFLPYPSDFFRDPSTGAIVTTGAAKLKGKDNLSADTAEWRPIPGYSRIPTIVTLFGVGLDPGPLPGYFEDPELSRSPATSASLILEVATGRTIPHFADLDPRAASDETRALVLHPIVHLEEDTRYIVAFSGLVEAGGAPVAPPKGFRRIRDRELDGGPESLATLGARYETEVFPALEAAGLARAELQLAFDFTTGPDSGVAGDMLRARELAVEAVAAELPAIEITAVEEDPDPAARVWRIVRGKVTGPLVLESPRAGDGAALAVDGEGRVRLNGTLEFKFVALVPGTVRDDPAPGRALAYGHGFFGSAREIEDEAPIEIANRLHAVLFSIDWWGMSREDSLTVADSIVARPSHTASFTDGVHQAMVNWITFDRAIREALPALEGFQRPAGHAAAGAPVYDPESAGGLLGISQGHILGGVAASVVPGFSRIVLNAGGAGFTHMMFRARPFLTFLELFEFSVGDPLTMQKIVATLQRPFDRIDPATYARWIREEPLPGSPPDRKVLLQIGAGDTQVPHLAALLHGRTLGAGRTGQEGRVLYGLPIHDEQRAALTLYDFGVDESFTGLAVPPDHGNIVHDGIRQLDAAIEQMAELFERGRLVHTCDGACDPE